MGTYPLRIVDRRQEAPDAVSLWLDVPRDLSTAFHYQVGQFVTIEEDIAGEWVRRQYSLSSVPGLDPGLRITVKKVPGGRMSTWLVNTVKVGDVLEVAAPRGRLYVPSDESRNYLFVAAGSGIAPLIAIARHVLGANSGNRVTVAYGNRSVETIILRAEVDSIVESSHAIVEHVLSRPGPGWSGATGHVDPEYLSRRWEAWNRSALPVAAFLCGPEEFMTAAEKFLLERGIAINDIRSESFDLVLNEDDDDDGATDLVIPKSAELIEPQPCSILIAIVGGEEIECVPKDNEPLLSALLRAGADVPFSCQEGTCSSCIVKLREGRVRVRPGVLQTLRPSDLDEGLVLACLSRALTSTVKIDFDDL